MPGHAAGPLAGITILEIAYFVAGPLSATLLAELGARVIKVEPIEGDPSRRTGLQNSKFLAGKESIALDLKSKDGRQIMEQLLERSDALVHNFRPGVPDRLGFGYQDASRINPRLVYLYAASYGSQGPQAHRTAFHSTPNALCGGGILQAGQGNPPVDDSYCDPGSGLAAASALLLGLAARQVTGRGQYLETSMLASAAYVHSNDMVVGRGRPPRAQVDKGQHGTGPCYRLYPCRSGWLFLSAWRDRDFRRLAGALGRDDWLDNPDFASRDARRAAADKLSSELGGIFATRDAAEWIAALSLPQSLLVEVCDVPLERWFEQEELLLPMDHPEFGPYWQPPAKLSFDGTVRPAPPTCSLGEHTGTILAELGYDRDQIRSMHSAGAVLAPGV
jgi:crotonobetainyl-CoA:carnitine CoA-transferase CaiB-like acyl-CoA transferase